ncbi:MAG: hypothetical protein CM15mP122_2050 [Bacteroidota bacterium]|nr:MAG: hypothetical protein CM15mP122_2050 [Bacteroidota bacterium]
MPSGKTLVRGGLTKLGEWLAKLYLEWKIGVGIDSVNGGKEWPDLVYQWERQLNLMADRERVVTAGHGSTCCSCRASGSMRYYLQELSNTNDQEYATSTVVNGVCNHNQSA